MCKYDCGIYVAYTCRKYVYINENSIFDRLPTPQSHFLKVVKVELLRTYRTLNLVDLEDFWTWALKCSKIGISGPILMILVPISTNLRSLSSNTMRKSRKKCFFIESFGLEIGSKQQKWHYLRSKLNMKEAKIFNFLTRIELADLKLVDIGTKIIKIGP